MCSLTTVLTDASKTESFLLLLIPELKEEIFETASVA
jgi:hypothetical protein